MVVGSPALTGYRIDTKRLRELRLGVPLTVDELARRCNIAYVTLLRVEQGKQHPRIETIRILARELKCDPSDLIIVEPETDVDARSAV